jgi:hypothetical protein
MLKSISESGTGLFDRLKKVVAKEFFLREIISSSIKSISGVDVPVSSIKINGSIIRINVNANFKSAIFTRKQKIIDAITLKVEAQSIDMIVTDIQ